MDIPEGVALVELEDMTRVVLRPRSSTDQIIHIDLPNEGGLIQFRQFNEPKQRQKDLLSLLLPVGLVIGVVWVGTPNKVPLPLSVFLIGLCAVALITILLRGRRVRTIRIGRDEVALCSTGVVRRRARRWSAKEVNSVSIRLDEWSLLADGMRTYELFLHSCNGETTRLIGHTNTIELTWLGDLIRETIHLSDEIHDEHSHFTVENNDFCVSASSALGPTIDLNTLGQCFNARLIESDKGGTLNVSVSHRKFRFVYYTAAIAVIVAVSVLLIVLALAKWPVWLGVLTVLAALTPSVLLWLIGTELRDSWAIITWMKSKVRLDTAGQSVAWNVGDITSFSLVKSTQFDVSWDRAGSRWWPVHVGRGRAVRIQYHDGGSMDVALPFRRKHCELLIRYLAMQSHPDRIAD